MSNGPAYFDRVRKLYKGTDSGPYCDVAARGLISHDSQNAVAKHLEESALGIIDKAQLFEKIETTRKLFARLVRTSPDNVAFTKNITDGLATLAGSIEWHENDTVVICEQLEHPANIYPWYGISRRNGIKVKNVAAENGKIPVAKIIDAMDSSCRVVSVSAVSFAPGFRLSLDEIAIECRRRGVILIVDAAQSIGIIDTDVEKLGVGALVTSTQKGLLSLYGMGFLYIRRDLADQIRPSHLSRFGINYDGHEASTGNLNDFRYATGARRFDVGNFNFPAALAVEPSLKLLLELGQINVQRHVFGVARYFAEEIQRIGLPLFGEWSEMHGSHIVTVGEHIGIEHGQTASHRIAALYSLLTERGVRLSIRRDLLRFSFHIYNNTYDVDFIIDICNEFLSTNHIH